MAKSKLKLGKLTSEEAMRILKVGKTLFYSKIIPALKKRGKLQKVGTRYRFNEKDLLETMVKEDILTYGEKASPTARKKFVEKTKTSRRKSGAKKKSPGQKPRAKKKK